MLPIDIASATVWQHFLQCQTCHKHEHKCDIARTTLLRCLLTFHLFLLGLKYCSSVNISRLRDWDFLFIHRLVLLCIKHTIDFILSFVNWFSSTLTQNCYFITAVIAFASFRIKCGAIYFFNSEMIIRTDTIHCILKIHII